MRNAMKLFYLFLSFFITFTSIQFAQDGTWVNEFGTSGTVIHDLQDWDTRITHMKIIDDNKILVGGYINYRPTREFNSVSIFTAYMNSAGEFITSGTTQNGVYMLNEGWQDLLNDMKVQYDNKIVIAGAILGNMPPCNNCNNRMLLTRLNTDGSIDSTFGTEGFVNINSFSEVKFITLLRNGKILCYTTDITDNTPTLFLVNNEGEIDYNFANNGFRKLDYKFTTVNTLPENSTILTGMNNGNLVIQKLLSNGENDLSFGAQGILIHSGLGLGKTHNCEILSNGKILIAADFANFVKLNSDGSLDNSFGVNGVISNADALDQFFVYGNSETTQIKALTNNKFIVSGELSTLDQWTDLFLFQCNENGFVDSSFGVSPGYTRTYNINKSYFQVTKAMDLFSDGKILLGGFELVRHSSPTSEYYEYNLLLAKFSGTSQSMKDERALLITSPNGGEQLNKNEEVTITWGSRSISEINIEFSSDGGENWTPVVSALPSTELEYKWLTPDVQSDSCLLRIFDNDSLFIDLSDSLFSIVSVVGVEKKDTFPLHFSIEQNYPNPFNPATTINYSVPKTSVVTLKVYDILGKEIAVLVNEEKAPGNYKIQFDGNVLSSGVYFYRLQSDRFSQTKKLILMK